MAKSGQFAGTLSAAIGVFGGGGPVKIIVGQVSDVSFVKTRWKGAGENLQEEDLLPSEHYTRVEIAWLGGNVRVALPATMKDVSARIPIGSGVMAVFPLKSKNGVLKDDREKVELIGAGLSRFDEMFNADLLDHAPPARAAA